MGAGRVCTSTTFTINSSLLALTLADLRIIRPSKQVFEPGVVLADGEFSGLESVVLGAPLEMTNNYMDAIAYNEVCARANRLLSSIRVGGGSLLRRLQLSSCLSFRWRAVSSTCQRGGNTKKTPEHMTIANNYHISLHLLSRVSFTPISVSRLYPRRPTVPYSDILCAQVSMWETPGAGGL